MLASQLRARLCRSAEQLAAGHLAYLDENATAACREDLAWRTDPAFISQQAYDVKHAPKHATHALGINRARLDDGAVEVSRGLVRSACVVAKHKGQSAKKRPSFAKAASSNHTRRSHTTRDVCASARRRRRQRRWRRCGCTQRRSQWCGAVFLPVQHNILDPTLEEIHYLVLVVLALVVLEVLADTRCVPIPSPLQLFLELVTLVEQDEDSGIREAVAVANLRAGEEEGHNKGACAIVRVVRARRECRGRGAMRVTWGARRECRGGTVQCAAGDVVSAP